MYLAQNADEYYVGERLGGETSFMKYEGIPKNMPSKDAEKTGSETLSTIDGSKDLEIWEYTDRAGNKITSHYDPATRIVYREAGVLNGTPATLELKSYDAVWQTEYSSSDAVGKTFEYAYAVAGVTFSAKVVCVADSSDGKYMALYDFTEIEVPELYLLSGQPEGLPTDAVDSETTLELDTIDGQITAEVWTLTEDGVGMIFYVDPDSGIIYRIALSSDGVQIPFNLTQRPE